MSLLVPVPWSSPAVAWDVERHWAPDRSSPNRFPTMKSGRDALRTHRKTAERTVLPTKLSQVVSLTMGVRPATCGYGDHGARPLRTPMNEVAELPESADAP